MFRKIRSIVILTVLLTTGTFFIGNRIAQANPVCEKYPSLCGYPDPDGRTGTAYSLSPEPLEKEIRQGKATVDTYMTLGYIYLRMEKFQLSEARYKQGIKKAIIAKDKQKQAFGYVGLGEVNVSVGNKNKAVAYFNRAIKIFKAIGDEESANIVRKRRKEIWHPVGDRQSKGFSHRKQGVFSMSLRAIA